MDSDAFMGQLSQLFQSYQSGKAQTKPEAVIKTEGGTKHSQPNNGSKGKFGKNPKNTPQSIVPQKFSCSTAEVAANSRDAWSISNPCYMCLQYGHTGSHHSGQWDNDDKQRYAAHKTIWTIIRNWIVLNPEYTKRQLVSLLTECAGGYPRYCDGTDPNVTTSKKDKGKGKKKQDKQPIETTEAVAAPAPYFASLACAGSPDVPTESESGTSSGTALPTTEGFHFDSTSEPMEANFGDGTNPWANPNLVAKKKIVKVRRNVVNVDIQKIDCRVSTVETNIARIERSIDQLTKDNAISYDVITKALMAGGVVSQDVMDKLAADAKNGLCIDDGKKDDLPHENTSLSIQEKNTTVGSVDIDTGSTVLPNVPPTDQTSALSKRGLDEDTLDNDSFKALKSLNLTQLNNIVKQNDDSTPAIPEARRILDATHWISLVRTEGLFCIVLEPEWDANPPAVQKPMVSVNTVKKTYVVRELRSLGHTKEGRLRMTVLPRQRDGLTKSELADSQGPSGTSWEVGLDKMFLSREAANRKLTHLNPVSKRGRSGDSDDEDEFLSQNSTSSAMAQNSI
jgi:hypothetical protein